MMLRDDQELANTEQKLAELGKRIEVARGRPQTDANVASLRSLMQMENQLREEIIRYRSRLHRQAS